MASTVIKPVREWFTRPSVREEMDMINKFVNLGTVGSGTVTSEGQIRVDWVGVELVPQSATAVAEPAVTIPAKPSRTKVQPELDRKAMEEYVAVAKQIGLAVPEIAVEKFKQFLIEHDLPVYDNVEVKTYMDALAKRDGKGYGWHWAPLRQKDKKGDFSFGSPSCSYSRVASDYFNSGNQQYAKPVPLHALRRVALIEQKFKDNEVVFAVSDYTTEPHIRPDPFLIAIIPNRQNDDGIGRFVIDVWDEPGFGIDKMIKSGL